ncbi:MAG: hypothetical protein AAFR88_06505 [Pseudomonadota bacterium]
MTSLGFGASGPLSSWVFNNLGSDWIDSAPLQLGPEAGPLLEPTQIIVAGSSFFLAFGQLARFKICFSDHTVTAFGVDEAVTQPDLEHFLRDHLVPRILAEEGRLVIHGSAVKIAGSLAVFIGESGAGKSTLAASLHEAGHVLFGDDAVIIDNHADIYTGQSTYRSLRLYPETVSAVLGEKADTTIMAHYSRKRRVVMGSSDVENAQIAPIGAVFILSDEPCEDAVRDHDLKPSEVCMAIIKQSFALNSQNAELAAKRLSQASNLADAVPGYRLTYPHDYARLREVRSVIEARMDEAQKKALSSHQSTVE